MIVKSVQLVNDVAERGVSLIQQFNASITRDEEQKQYLLQIVENHRQTFVGCKKVWLNHWMYNNVTTNCFFEYACYCIRNFDRVVQVVNDENKF